MRDLQAQKRLLSVPPDEGVADPRERTVCGRKTPFSIGMNRRQLLRLQSGLPMPQRATHHRTILILVEDGHVTARIHLGSNLPVFTGHRLLIAVGLDGEHPELVGLGILDIPFRF